MRRSLANYSYKALESFDLTRTRHSIHTHICFLWTVQRSNCLSLTARWSDQAISGMAQQNAGTRNLVQKKDKTLLLRFPPIYVIVGAYRFVTDPKINRPIWFVA